MPRRSGFARYRLFSTGGDSSKRLTWLKRCSATVTFALAVIGAVTGFISFRRSNDIHVEMTARQTTFALRSFEIGIVNSSQRAVSVTGGKLYFDGYQVGEVHRLVPGARPDQAGSGTTPAAGAPLPYSLAGGQAFAGTLTWRMPDDGWSPVVLERFSKYIGRGRHGGQRPDGRFTVDLELEPGGHIKRSVVLGVGAVQEDGDGHQTGHRPGWQTLLALSRSDRAVQALLVYHLVPDPAVASFELWGAADRPLHSARRPVVEASLGPTRFAFPRSLPAGRYSWAVEVDGKTVASGAFRTPCKASPRRHAAVPSDLCLT